MWRAVLLEAISVAGTIIAVFFVRYLMDLSTPAQDWWVMQRFAASSIHRWESGSFTNVLAYERARRLLDY